VLTAVEPQPPNSIEWVTRSDAARRLGEKPYAISRWVKKWPEMAESKEDRSRVNFKALREKVEQERAAKRRDEEIRDRTRAEVNKDKKLATKQFHNDNHPKRPTRRQ
jgi:hypothetical protein